jgi:maltokinase
MTVPSAQMAHFTQLPFAEWLPRQRWYAGRNRDIEVVRPNVVTPLSDDLDHLLLDVAYSDGSRDRYQLFVQYDQAPIGEYAEKAFIGSGQDASGRERIGYEALYDGRAARRILDLIDSDVEIGGLRFLREPGARLPVGAPARIGAAEQSNTSVIFDSAALMKVFRRVPPGINPDLELNRVLARAGSTHVAQLLGAIETSDAEGQPLTLAMVSQFAQGSVEGWAMATTSARDLLASADQHAYEVGGDFSGESFRLGEAVASVHRTLASHLGERTGRLPLESMLARLEEATAVVGELTAYAGRARAVLEAAAVHEIAMQRVHGDLHLGQVLRSPAGWLLIDFEGEPGKPISERSRLDSPLRDVAGMLRSFEYAAYQVLLGQIADHTTNGAKLDKVAREWIDRNQDAFCTGYAREAGYDPRTHAAVLRAYELDKMVYEAAYEARHRPGWLRIPMKSIDRLLG